MYTISIFLLIFVLFFGQEVNNHTSWFNFFGFKFQPSEFSKLSTALLLAKVFDSYSIKLNKVRDFLMVSSIIILPSIIILFQGGHGFKILEKTNIIEIKQGPYVEGKDKKIIEK